MVIAAWLMGKTLQKSLIDSLKNYMVGDQTVKALITKGFDQFYM